MRLFAGIDLGTGGCRCAVFDETGARVAYAARAWAYDTDPFPVLDPGVASVAVRDAMNEAARACDLERVAAIGVTSQRTGVVFVDRSGRELLISPNTDGRAAMQGIEQERAHGETIYRIAGRLPAMIYMPARLAWARANLAEPVEAVLALSDWLVWRMTGARATEPTQAAEMLCYDAGAGVWSDELCALLDVAPDVLPEVRASGEAVGALGEGWGFAAGTPVVPGGADTQCAALGLGALVPQHAVVIAGTTMLAEHVIERPSIDPSGRLWTSPTPLEVFVHEAHCGEAGAFLSWVASLMGTDVSGLDALARRGRPGAAGTLVVDAFAGAASDFPLVRRGVITFAAPVLALGASREDVARACIESVAFGARDGLDWLAEVAGAPVGVAAGGGVTRSDVFVAALAGAGERTVRVATDEASSARGAAIVAGAAHHGGVGAAAEAMADRGREVAPVPSDGYPAHYAAWKQVADEARVNAKTMKGIVG